MILIVDDDKRYADSLAELLHKRGYKATVAYTASSALAAVRDSRKLVKCVILDVKMPGGRAFSTEATAGGRYTGIHVLTSIRSVLPDVPVFVVTGYPDPHTYRWVATQRPCQYWSKDSLFAGFDRLLVEIDKALSKLGARLLSRLRSCPLGRVGYLAYEDLCVDVLRYLFVPPFPAVHVQSRTADGHEIRDAIMINADTTGFWADLRREFGSVNIPCEFKNYRQPVGTKEVQQLQLRLDKPSLGRFGLLFSREGANRGAELQQRLAYSTSPKKLILIVDRKTVAKMIREKDRGGKPEALLQELKTRFELSF